MLTLNKLTKVITNLLTISFQVRVFILLLFTSLLVLIAVERFLTYHFEHYQLNQTSLMVMNQAKLIATRDDIIEAVKQRDKDRLNKIVSQLHSYIDFSYIVIGDQNSIRLYHPDKNKIGHLMSNNKPGALDKGESYIITEQPSSIGLALRAKTPIYDEHHHVIGIISLGYLLSKINNWHIDYILSIISFFSFLLLILIFFSWRFSVHIKQQMMGMEPKTIARVQRQQDALFSAVFEGLLAVDPQGQITAINNNARKMLEIKQPAEQVLGKQINVIVSPSDFFMAQPVEDCQDIICVFNHTKVIANRSGIWIDNIFQGWVVSFRRKDDINTLNAQLSQIQQYVDNLRTLRHEHLNWIATLNGLLQMKEYEHAHNMIMQESSNQQILIDSIRSMFKKTLISALLFGKYHRAKELGITLSFVEGCHLSSIPYGMDENELATIIGNLLDNAFEATLANPESDKIVELYLSDQQHDFIIEVSDTGCGIEPDIYHQIFLRGVSSKKEKEHGHGIGLYLVATYVKQCDGEVIIEPNTPFGTRFLIIIPDSEKNNERA